MGIVIPQNSLSTRRMQRQSISDPMRDILTRLNFPRLNLEPITELLIKDLTMQIQEGSNFMIFDAESISADDILADRLCLGRNTRIVVGRAF